MSFAPEDQLLIRCASTTMSDDSIDQVARLVREDLDWDYVLEASIRHGVSPLLYHGLNQVFAAHTARVRVPQHIMAQLEQLYQNTRMRNRRLYRVLGEICRAFERAGIPALGLKDVHLAMDVYQDLGLRPMGDIDILIRQEDYARVARCMADVGFSPLPSADIPFTLKYAWAHHFHRPIDDVWADVQWGIMQREWDVYKEGNVTFDIATMWRGAAPLVIDDYRILVPSPEDMLFHLCLHLEGHGYCELILFCDIAELLRRHHNDFDWPSFLRLTRQCHAESSVYYVLFLVQRLFDMPLPPHVLQHLEPSFFPGALLEPLFGNLTRLHLSLDETRLAVAPPSDLLQEWEATVRRQAVGAMHAYRTLDALVNAFKGVGGEVAILEGAPSEREFPDASVRPFQVLQMLIFEQDLPRMREAMLRSGLRPVQDAPIERYSHRREIASKDPILVGQPIQMSLHVDIVQDAAMILRHDGSSVASKKDVALRSIKSRLGGHRTDGARMSVRMRIVALSPEDVLLYLSARQGQRRQGRLFGLCSLLEYFRHHRTPPDWQQIGRTAAHYGLSRHACEGLLMVRDLVDAGQVPCSALNALACSGSAPRVLEAARYDPTSWGRYTGFKSGFFYLFTVLSIHGMPGKLRYVARSLRGARHSSPVLLGVARDVGASVVGLRGRQQRVARDFAYWMKPESALPDGRLSTPSSASSTHTACRPSLSTTGVADVAN